MVIARTVEGDIGVLRGHAPRAVAAHRRGRRDRRRGRRDRASPPSTAASSRWPTTGSRSCPSTPCSRPTSTSSAERAELEAAQAERGRRRRGAGSAGPRPGSARPRGPEPGRSLPLGARRMPLWEWLLDAAGLLLVLVLLYGVVLVAPATGAVPARRHLRAEPPARPGHAPAAAGCSAWGATRVTSSSGSGSSRSRRGPSGSGAARGCPTTAAASREAWSGTSLYPDHVVIACTTPDGRGRAGDERRLADRLPGLARVAPPGTDWSR